MGLGKFLPGAGKVISTIDSVLNATNILPILEEAADVTVYGNPTASRNEMYFLAVSIAFGLMSRKDALHFTPPLGLISIEYNAELNRVRFYAQQNVPWRNMIATSAYKAWAAGDYFNLQIFNGPLDSVTGGEWQWNAYAVPGFPGKNPITGTGKDIKLAFAGTDLITPKAQSTLLDPIADSFYIGNSKSPVPPGDDKSRGAPTLASDPSTAIFGNTLNNPEYLIWAALAGPCDATANLFQIPNIQAELRTKPPPAGDFGAGGDFGDTYEFMPIPPALPTGMQLPAPRPPVVEDLFGYPLVAPVPSHQ